MYKNVEVEVAELAMVTMEAFGKGMAVDKLCKAASEKTSLQVCWNELISGYPISHVQINCDILYYLK